VILNLIQVAPSLSLLDDVTSLGQIVHDAVRASLGDAELRGDVLQANFRIVCDTEEHSAVIGKKVPRGHGGNLADDS
jgi:hypothetical protein